MLKRFAKALEISVEQLLNEGDEPLDQTEQHIERYERLNAKNQEMGQDEPPRLRTGDVSILGVR